MKSFTKGLFWGATAAVGLIASGVATFHKKVIQPIEETETKLDENRRAANRKNRSAHQL